MCSILGAAGMSQQSAGSGGGATQHTSKAARRRPRRDQGSFSVGLSCDALLDDGELLQPGLAKLFDDADVLDCLDAVLD